MGSACSKSTVQVHTYDNAENDNESEENEMTDKVENHPSEFSTADRPRMRFQSQDTLTTQESVPEVFIKDLSDFVEQTFYMDNLLDPEEKTEKFDLDKSETTNEDNLNKLNRNVQNYKTPGFTQPDDHQALNKYGKFSRREDKRFSVKEINVKVVNSGSQTKLLPTCFEESSTKPSDTSFQRVIIKNKSNCFVKEMEDISSSLIHALRLRQYYMHVSMQEFPALVAKTLAKTSGAAPNFPETLTKENAFGEHLIVVSHQGLMTVVNEQLGTAIPLPTISREKFISDRNLVYALVSNGPLKTFTYKRLTYLENKFTMHKMLNEWAELSECKDPNRRCRRDFYNVRKVDTHIHAAGCMGQKFLLGFIQEKAAKEPNRVVIIDNGKELTLKQVFEKLNLDPQYLNVDSLDVHCDSRTFQRFDLFNDLYSPMGAFELREIFLKTNNYIRGEYFAEMLKRLDKMLIDNKYHHLEMRLSIYGKTYDEWKMLASWFQKNNLKSTHIKWMIQVPRIYDIIKEKKCIKSFEEMLVNIFKPIFEATLYPNKHKVIHDFLRQIVGFDSVDDESKPESDFLKKSSPFPDQWNKKKNLSYSSYIFYMYTNIVRLNHLRHSRGLNTFTLRPHSGEAGHHDHLVTTFLLSDNIAHGIVLRKFPVLQYLYYLAQIGISMSPLSNNHLFLTYNKNPFPEYFARGLKVCLSTDDPLQFHYTNEPLSEEYAVAAQVWKLSVCDMCEIARNSVVISDFPSQDKQRWLGEAYRKEGVAGNDVTRTNVPNIRVAYRYETLTDELGVLESGINQEANDD